MIKKLINNIFSKAVVLLIVLLIFYATAMIGYYCGINYAIAHTEVLVVDENISLLRLEDRNFWTVNKH